MLATKIEQKKNEEGFTLIELLVVVIIIGILAAIAIPAFLNQRESAWRASAESDVRNAAITVETYYTEFRAYPADLAAFQTDVRTDPNVTLGYQRSTDGNSFQLSACHALVETTCAAGYQTSTTANYDSNLGGLQQ